jgi:hypothetical protein
MLTISMVAQIVSADHPVTVTVSFSEDQLHFDHIMGYDRVRLAGGDLISLPGTPMLPAQPIMVAIPGGSRAVNISAHSLDRLELTGTYNIFPGQPPARLDGSPPPPFSEPDAAIYRSSDPYPGSLAQLSDQTDLAGQQMAAIAVFPLQYVPSEGRLILHRLIQIDVETRPGHVSEEAYLQLTEKQRRIYGDMIRRMVVNPQDVVLDPPRRETSKSLPSGQFDHVVITPQAFESYFGDLVDWHNRRGLRDTVVVTEYIYANYGGSDDAAKIRNFVIDAAGTWGTIYFLIGGEHEHVPFRYRNYDGTDTPSDNYYADYDDDWTCEVLVGRITGSGEAQFSCAIDKILDYEKSPALGNYVLDVLLIGMDVDASTHCEELKDIIDSFIPPRFNVTKVYDSDSGNHKTAAIAALNDGQNLVNHADHANSTVLGTGDRNHGWHIYRSDVDALTNDGRPSNLVSLGCWPNNMNYSQCIAEHFVTDNPDQAGVSFTGNTRSGWYYVGNPTGLSNQLDRNWWYAVFQMDQFELGQALVASKHLFDQSRSSTHKHCEWTFNLLGEPSMPLWTRTLSLLTVTHPATLPLGGSTFTVHVASGDEDLEGATVCLYKPGDVYLTGLTDGNGDVVFTPSPTSYGDLYVTVTKQDHIPSENVSQVTELAPPPVTDLAIGLRHDDIFLSWSPSPEESVTRYVVYRQTDSEFLPAPQDSIGGTADTAYFDLGAAGTAGTNYYYAVKAVNGTGQKSDPSGIAGEYDIHLLHETPER